MRVTDIVTALETSKRVYITHEVNISCFIVYRVVLNYVIIVYKQK